MASKPKDEPDYTAMGRLDLYTKAKADHAAMKEAKQKGEPIPATPALDELHRRHEDMTSTRKTKTTAAGRTKGRTDIRYFHDGMSMSEGHKHKLSTVAYFYSFDLDGDKPRVGTADFTAALKKAGVTDPGQPGWMVKLPNGVTIECRLDKEKSQFKGEPHKRSTARGATPKDAVAKKVTAALAPTKAPAKATAPAAKKPAASKVGKSARAAAVKAANTPKAATKKVTPIPKKQPVKKAAPKKAMKRTA